MAHAMERTGLRKLVERRLASSNYRLLKVLGEGTYGTVYLARDGVNKQLVAIKVIEKRRISPEDMVRVRREIQVLSVLRQPNIIQIFRVHEDDTSLYLVMEFADGGELYDFVERRKKLSSTEARAVFRQIVAAVHYCHKNGVVHRDLKLENILLNSRFEVKLTDFGLCNYFTPTGRLATFCGSPLYASPEIISGSPYMGPEIDCWSLGVLLYALVYGSMPFGHAEFAKLRDQILSGQFFAPPDAGEFSDAHDLICQCLTVSAPRRATIDQISMHWWTNIGYVHYPHCDIYGGGDPTQQQQQPTCSCFFDVLSQQLSSPPDQFRGKLAKKNRGTSSGNSNNEYKGVHAHRNHHHHRNRSKQKVPSSTSQKEPPFPTPNSPPSPKNGGDMVVRSVSADSLNQNGDELNLEKGTWKFFQLQNQQQQQQNSRIVEPLRVIDDDTKKNDKILPNKMQRSSSAPGFLESKPSRQVSTTNFQLPILSNRRSASLGRRPLVWRSKVLFEKEQQNLAKEELLKLQQQQNGHDKLLSSLLDPSDDDDDDGEHFEACGGAQSDSVLHRQLSNYDNLGGDGGRLSVSPHANNNNNCTIDLPPPIDSFFDASVNVALRSVPHGNGHSSNTYGSSPYLSESCSSSVSHSGSCSGSSGSLSCSCSCSSIYDGFVGTAAIQKQQQTLDQEMVVPPLEFLSSNNNNNNGDDEISSSSSSSTSHGGINSSSSGELVVDQSARSAPAALAIANNSNNNDQNKQQPTSSKPSTLIDSISSSGRSDDDNNNNNNNNSRIHQLRVLDDDELIALSRENMDDESDD